MCRFAVDGIVLAAHYGVPVRGVRDWVGGAQCIDVCVDVFVCGVLRCFRGFCGVVCGVVCGIFYMGNL